MQSYSEYDGWAGTRANEPGTSDGLINLLAARRSLLPRTLSPARQPIISVCFRTCTTAPPAPSVIETTVAAGMLRHVASRAFFTAATVAPPNVVAVGVRALLGYNPEQHAKNLLQAAPAARVLSESTVKSALAFVDENVPQGECRATADYVAALNASLVTFAGDQPGKAVSPAMLEAIEGIPESAHYEALRQSLKVADPLLRVLQVIHRSSEKCKLALLADGGPLLKVMPDDDARCLLPPHDRCGRPLDRPALTTCACMRVRPACVYVDVCNCMHAGRDQERLRQRVCAHGRRQYLPVVRARQGAPPQCRRAPLRGEQAVRRADIRPFHRQRSASCSQQANERAIEQAVPLHAARRTLRASRVVRWFCVLALLHTATPSLCMVVMKKLFLVAACFAMDDCL